MNRTEKLHYFKLGFEAGKSEQLKEDFPDVGFRFPKTAEEYFNDLPEADVKGDK